MVLRPRSKYIRQRFTSLHLALSAMFPLHALHGESMSPFKTPSRLVYPRICDSCWHCKLPNQVPVRLAVATEHEQSVTGYYLERGDNVGGQTRKKTSRNNPFLYAATGLSELEGSLQTLERQSRNKWRLQVWCPETRPECPFVWNSAHQKWCCSNPLVWDINCRLFSTRT